MSSPPAHRPGHVRRSSTEMDKLRGEAAAAATKARALDTNEWMSTVLKWDNENKAETDDERLQAFFYRIESGVALCELLATIDSQYAIKYKAEAAAGSFQ